MNRADVVGRNKEHQKKPPVIEPHFAEQHYRVPQLAKMWGLSPAAVRDMFRKEPGVVALPKRSTSKQPHTTLLIPSSVANRVWATLRAVS